MTEADARLEHSIELAIAWAMVSQRHPRHVGALDAEFDKFLARIEEDVAAHPLLGALDGKAVASGAGAARVSHRLVARFLLERGYEHSTDISGVLKHVADFVQNPRTEVLSVLTLAGVEVEDEIALTARTAIVPPRLLPKTENRDRYFPDDIRRAERRIFHPGEVFPTAAIVHRWSIEHAIYDNLLQAAHLANPRGEDAEFDRAQAALILCTSQPVQRLHGYYENLHPGHIWPGSGWSEHETLAWHGDCSIVGSEVAEIYVLIERFEEWSEFWRLTRRLNKARRKDDLVDAHIDLGIVAECALTKGDSREAEISLRLRMRAAWLLGGTPDARRSIAKAMTALYNRRSSAAHTGLIGAASPDTFRQDGALCCQLLTAILRRGRFPKSEDWPSIVYG